MPLTAGSTNTQYKTKPLPPVVAITPFAFSTPESASEPLIAYRSADQMNEADRDLAAKAVPSIREGATLAGIDFDKGGWTYQQLVCKALPGHVFLLFNNNSGRHDASSFSAAIPRSSSKTRVRIIPIQRRGYSLYSPAPVNALTISAFNRIRADEPQSNATDWLAIALCYAALTGPMPEISLPSNKSAGKELPLSFPPTLEVQPSGKSIVRFIDVATPRQPMQWVLTFDVKGHLIKVTRFATAALATKPVP
jgi:hypothetical protein